MARTYVRPPTRSSSRTIRPPAPRRSGGGFRLPSIRLNLGKLVRPLAMALAVVLGVLAAMGFLLFGAFIALPYALRTLVSLLGFGAALPLPAVAVLAWRGHVLGKGGLLRQHWNHLLGGAALYCGMLAVASLFGPSGYDFLGVSWYEVSLGGFLGQVIMGEPGPARLLRAGGPLLLGAVLVYPRSLPLLLGLLWAALQGLAGLRLPQRAFGLLRNQIAQARAALRDQPSTKNDLDETPAGIYDDEIDDYDYTAADTSAAIADKSGYQGALLPVIPAADREEADEAPPPRWSRWELPAVDLLEAGKEAEPVDQTQRAKQIEEALESYGVEAKVAQIHVGPAVTQFGLEPGWDRKYKEVKERDITGKVKLDKDGNAKAHQEEVSRTRVKVERITSLSNNLALALAAPSVRIEAPVPGKNVVGIEVPNLSPEVVPMRSVIESSGFQRLRNRSKLALALGKGVAGDVVVADLARMPHLLIAGATGSGKSVCINSIVNCLLMHGSPDEVRLLMIDPKRVELVPYNPIPHLLCPVIVDAEKVVGTLQWVIKEMDNRYRKFAAVGVRNIEGYNRSPKVEEQLPYWVLIIDELADLMMVAPFEVERALCRLAQLARATGIHLVVATQRPSVDVITGLIKANFPTRISFAVTSQIDSRTILDGAGAEKLLGRGDMLFMATDAAKPRRVQGAYVSDDDVERLVEYWSHDRFQLLRPPQFGLDIEHAAMAATGAEASMDDPLLERARELAESSERISASFLQRRLRVGYPRAARLMELLQDEGYGDMVHEDRF